MIDSARFLPFFNPLGVHQDVGALGFTHESMCVCTMLNGFYATFIQTKSCKVVDLYGQAPTLVVVVNRQGLPWDWTGLHNPPGSPTSGPSIQYARPGLRNMRPGSAVMRETITPMR
ncbi:hypothetical protein FS763_05270 [Agrobacterium vitis]|uniref:hypothetical protein n=1 Tax=Allorhizobium ampelinum TaxID=3025782 RepID=UPI001F1D1BA5|nr:hypothetical protein [Allorhizobium ampelinum]MCF1471334.1 hypothetical protein [Allorhizobium ampelinum]